MTGWKTFASPVYSVLLKNVSAGFSKQFEVEGEKQTVVLQLTVLKRVRAAWWEGASGKSLILVINFYFYKLWGCKSLFTNTGIIHYMYAWSYILIQKNVRIKQNKNEIPWIYMYKNFGRSKVQVTFHTGQVSTGHCSID